MLGNLAQYGKYLEQPNKRLNIYSAPLASLAALARSLRAPCQVERFGAICDKCAPFWAYKTALASQKTLKFLGFFYYVCNSLHP